MRNNFTVRLPKQFIQYKVINYKFVAKSKQKKSLMSAIFIY